MRQVLDKAPAERQLKILAGLLGFLALNLIFYGLVIHPAKSKLHDREERLERIRRDRTVSLRLLESRESDKANLDRIIEAVRSFYFEVLSTREERMNPVRDEITRLARQFNVNLEKRSYPIQHWEEVGVDEFRIKFPLQGQFQDVGRFINQIENSENFLLIDRITLRASDETGRMLQLNVDLSTYFCAVGTLEELLARGSRRS